MSNPAEKVKVSEITRKGDYYRVSGKDGDGRSGSVEIPARTLESLSRKEGEALIRRGVYGTIHAERS